MLHREVYNPNWNWRSKIILNDYIRIFDDDNNLVGQESPPEGLGLLGLFNRYRIHEYERGMDEKGNYVIPDEMTRERLIDGQLAGSQIELRTVAPSFSLAVKSTMNRLPAVSFGFGNNRGLETGTTEGISGRTNIYVYTEVNTSVKHIKHEGLFPREPAFEGDKNDKMAVLTPETVILDSEHHQIPQTIIERAGGMYSLVEEVIADLRTFSPDGVDIHNVRIADMRTPEVKLSEKEFMLFVISVDFEGF